LKVRRRKTVLDSAGSQESFIMEYIARLIEDNYMEDLTRDELAKRHA